MKIYVSLSASNEDRLLKQVNDFLDDVLYRTPNNLANKVKSSRMYAADQKTLLKYLENFGLTPDQHAKRADKCVRLIEKLRAAWGKKVEVEWKKLTGEKWKFGDYKVSGIAREEFPEEVKQRLRLFTNMENNLHDLANAHAVCAKERK